MQIKLYIKLQLLPQTQQYETIMRQYETSGNWQKGNNQCLLYELCKTQIHCVAECRVLTFTSGETYSDSWALDGEGAATSSSANLSSRFPFFWDMALRPQRWGHDAVSKCRAPVTQWRGATSQKNGDQLQHCKSLKFRNLLLLSH
jgi:hypothetical protein